jgi:hypothetical protein
MITLLILIFTKIILDYSYALKIDYWRAVRGYSKTKGRGGRVEHLGQRGGDLLFIAPRDC